MPRNFKWREFSEILFPSDCAWLRTFSPINQRFCWNIASNSWFTNERLSEAMFHLLREESINSESHRNWYNRPFFEIPNKACADFPFALVSSNSSTLWRNHPQQTTVFGVALAFIVYLLGCCHVCCSKQSKTAAAAVELYKRTPSLLWCL